MEKIYKQNIDRFHKILYLFILSLLVFMAVISLAILKEKMIGFAIFIFATILLMTFFIVGKSYTLYDDYLEIRSGFFWTKIRYDEITNVVMAKNLWSTLGAGIQKIGISTDERLSYFSYLFISPQNIDAFFLDLQELCAKHKH